MNAITSYIRHAIVVGVLFLVAKYKLPVEGADEFANGVALMGIGTFTWLIVKYLPAFAKQIGLLAFILMAMPSCADFPVTARIVGRDGALSYSAKGGLVLDAVIRATK